MDNRKTGRSTTWVKGMKSPNPKGRPPGLLTDVDAFQKNF